MSEEPKKQEATQQQTALAVEKKAEPGNIMADADGLVMADLKTIVQFGKYVVESKMYPALTNVTHVVISFQIARDHKVPVSLVLQNIAFINGRATVWGDCLLGMAMATGSLKDIEETIEGSLKDGTLKATCRVVSKDRPTPTVRTFDWQDAKTAGLDTKDTYKKWPKRMLQMRARSWALRDSGLTTGVMATEEALDTEQIVNTEVRVVTPTDGKARKFDFASGGQAAKVPESAPTIDGEPEPGPNAESETATEDAAPTGDLFGEGGQYVDLIEAVNDATAGSTKETVQRAIDALREAGAEVTFDSCQRAVQDILKKK